jgi:hypothetical protein
MPFKSVPITIKEQGDVNPLNIQRLISVISEQLKELYSENETLRDRVKALEDAE